MGFAGWFEILTHAPLEHPVQDLVTLPVILRVSLVISMVMLVFSMVILLISMGILVISMVMECES